MEISKRFDTFPCRGKDCDAELFMLDGTPYEVAKKPIIKFKEVDGRTKAFKTDGHVHHFTTCPNANDFS